MSRNELVVTRSRYCIPKVVLQIDITLRNHFTYSIVAFPCAFCTSDACRSKRQIANNGYSCFVTCQCTKAGARFYYIIVFNIVAEKTSHIA